jgi:hypothetical protein
MRLLFINLIILVAWVYIVGSFHFPKKLMLYYAPPLRQQANDINE